MITPFLGSMLAQLSRTTPVQPVTGFPTPSASPLSGATVATGASAPLPRQPLTSPGPALAPIAGVNPALSAVAGGLKQGRGAFAMLGGALESYLQSKDPYLQTLKRTALARERELQPLTEGEKEGYRRYFVPMLVKSGYKADDARTAIDSLLESSLNHAEANHRLDAAMRVARLAGTEAERHRHETVMEELGARREKRESEAGDLRQKLGERRLGLEERREKRESATGERRLGLEERREKRESATGERRLGLEERREKVREARIPAMKEAKAPSGLSAEDIDHLSRILVSTTDPLTGDVKPGLEVLHNAVDRELRSRIEPGASRSAAPAPTPAAGASGTKPAASGPGGTRPTSRKTAFSAPGSSSYHIPEKIRRAVGKKISWVDPAGTRIEGTLEIDPSGGWRVRKSDGTYRRFDLKPKK